VFITLVCTAVYLSDVAGSDTDSASSGDSSTATLTIPLTGTLVLPANAEFTSSLPAACKGAGNELDVLYAGREAPQPGTAFSVTVVSPSECTGTLTVPKDAEGVELLLDNPSG
jgi:hypothetical protein